MKICIAGKNEISVYGLKLAIDLVGKENVTVIPNSSDNGYSTWQPSLLRYANYYGVNVSSLQNLYGIDDLLFISLEFDKIINPNYFSSSSKLINLHFSKLPFYRGMYTSSWPILNGEKETAVTLHEIDCGIDSGKVIDQLSFKLYEDITARELYFLYMTYAKICLKNNLVGILNNKYISVSQDEKKATYYKIGSIDYRDNTADFNCTFRELSRKIRAFNFLEYQALRIGNFKISKCILTGEKSAIRYGNFLQLDEDTIAVNLIDQDVYLLRDNQLVYFEDVKRNNFDKVLSFGDKYINHINVTDSLGMTPICYAIDNNNTKMVKELIRQGADVNFMNVDGQTPLSSAYKNYNKHRENSVIKLLIENGSDDDLIDNFGNHPSFYRTNY